MSFAVAEHRHADAARPSAAPHWSNAYIVGILFLFSQTVATALKTPATFYAADLDISAQTRGMVMLGVSAVVLVLQLAIIVLLYVVAVKTVKNSHVLYFQFSGRISRKANFYSTLLPQIILTVVVLLVILIAFGIDGGTGEPRRLVAALASALLPFLCLSLALIWPYLAVRAKRAHDLGMSAWWLLLLLAPVAGNIFDLVLWFAPGQKQANRFGPDPLAASGS